MWTGLMFVTVVGLAIVAVPNIPEMFRGLVPIVPDHSAISALALAGGVAVRLPVELSTVLTDTFGDVVGVGFLVGFWAAAFSSIIGVWNGVSLMFADFWGNIWGKKSGHLDTRVGGKYFRFHILGLTFPPMILFSLGKPIGLILACGVLGSLLVPSLAITLLGLLNVKRVPRQWANKLHTNFALGICALPSAVLGVSELGKAIAKATGAASGG